MLKIIDVDNDEFIKAPGRKVVIFLSVFNVHVNRSPIAGEIKCQQYSCGRFDPAYKKDVGFENERHMIGIENEDLYIKAGFLKRPEIPLLKNQYTHLLFSTIKYLERIFLLANGW